MPDTPPSADPFDLFAAWFDEAKRTEPNDPEAMTLATATPGGRPSVRVLLLKGVDRSGFVFYTNLESRKSTELLANPQAAMGFHWKSLRRQVRIEGQVVAVAAAEADAYFASRPHGSQIGAWASLQSHPLDARASLERRVAEFTARYPEGSVPRPPYWSGYRVLPDSFEFWQNMPFRLHDRTIFERESGGGWRRGKLFP